MRTRTMSACIAVLAAAVVVLSGCSATGSSGGKGGNVTLSVWSWRPEDAATYRAIFAKFHDAHPNITVDFKPYKATEYNTILSTGLTQAGGPDVAQLRTYGGLQPLVEAKNLVPLDGKVAGLSNFAKTALDGARGKKDSKVYGVPLEVSTFQIYYNKDLFSKYHLSPPTTWDQLISAARTLKQNGVTPFAAAGKDTWLLPLYADAFGATRYGGPAFEQKVLSGQATFTDPAYVDSLNVLNQLKPYFPKDQMGLAETDVQTLFATGKAAMMPEGSFALAPTKAINPSLNLGVFDGAAGSGRDGRPPAGGRVGRRLVRAEREVQAPEGGAGTAAVDDEHAVRPARGRRPEADLAEQGRRAVGPAAQADGAGVPGRPHAVRDARRLPLRHAAGQRPGGRGPAEHAAGQAERGPGRR